MLARKFANRISTFCSSLPGFTLVELIVSMAIMSVVAGITLSGAPEARVRYSLVNDTFNTQVLIQEAQLQGSAVATINNTYAGSGVLINLATSTRLLKFKDHVIVDETKPIQTGNGIFDEATDEQTSFVNYINKNRLAKFCLTSSTSTVYCTTSQNDNLTISFTRPKQTAHMYWNYSTTTDFVKACIEVHSARAPDPGYVGAVYVYKSGLITKKIGRCV